MHCWQEFNLFSNMHSRSLDDIVLLGDGRLEAGVSDTSVVALSCFEQGYYRVSAREKRKLKVSHSVDEWLLVEVPF